MKAKFSLVQSFSEKKHKFEFALTSARLSLFGGSSYLLPASQLDHLKRTTVGTPTLGETPVVEKSGFSSGFVSSGSFAPSSGPRRPSGFAKIRSPFFPSCLHPIPPSSPAWRARRPLEQCTWRSTHSLSRTTRTGLGPSYDDDGRRQGRQGLRKGKGKGRVEVGTRRTPISRGQDPPASEEPDHVTRTRRCHRRRLQRRHPGVPDGRGMKSTFDWTLHSLTLLSFRRCWSWPATLPRILK